MFAAVEVVVKVEVGFAKEFPTSAFRLGFCGRDAPQKDGLGMGEGVRMAVAIAEEAGLAKYGIVRVAFASASAFAAFFFDDATVLAAAAATSPRSQGFCDSVADAAAATYSQSVVFHSKNGNPNV
jgi:hypothetical protein